MKRWLRVVLMLTVLLGTNFALPRGACTQVAHIGFEGFSLTPFSSGASVENTGSTWVKVASFVVSFPTEKYLSGVSVDWTSYNINSDGDGAMGPAFYRVKVVISSVEQVGPQYGQSTWKVDHFDTFAFTGLKGTSFTVDIYAQAYEGDDGDTQRVTINNVYVYSMEDDYGIKSKLTELKYIPPGADSTDTAIVLNKTEVLLPQAYNLTQGAMTFWIKWDGTNVSISDNIQAVVTYDDGHGTVYGGIKVVSSDGTVYELENVLLPGQYTKVYIGWAEGGGFVATDNATVNLNWKGSLYISKIGDLATASDTLVDEVNLYDSYVPLDALKSPNQATMVVNFPDGQATHIIVTDDGGDLDELTVSIYGLNMTLINSTTWKGIGNDISFSVNESLVLAVLSGPGGSTTVLVRPGVNETVVVPGTSSEHLQATIEPTSYPSGSQREWVWIIVRDSQGRLVYFNKWNFESTSVLLKTGESYMVAVANENLTAVHGVFFGLASPVMKITLPRLRDLTRFANITAFYSVNEDRETFRLYFYDPSGRTSRITVVTYDGMNTVATNATYYTSLLDLEFNYLPFKFTLSYERDGNEYNWTTVLGYVNSNNVASELGSSKLLGFALLEGMLFAFGALSAAWAPTVTMAFAIPLAVGGLIELPAVVITYLGGMAFFAWFQQVNLEAASLKQLASKVLLVVMLLQLAFGVANYFGYIGWGTGGFSTNELISAAGEQVVFWQNYTPTYSSYGIPIASDSSTMMNFGYAVLNSFGAVLMSLGAPPEFARMANALIWALESALALYLLLGREV